MATKEEILSEQVAHGIRLWTLVYPPPYLTVSPIGALGRIRTPSSGDIVVLFSDPDLAIKVRDAMMPVQMGVTTFTSSEHVRMSLNLVAKMGVTHVGIDFCPPIGDAPSTGEIVSVERALFIYGDGN